LMIVTGLFGHAVCADAPEAVKPDALANAAPLASLTNERRVVIITFPLDGFSCRCFCTLLGPKPAAAQEAERNQKSQFD
jgi:hypothetical protein